MSNLGDAIFERGFKKGYEQGFKKGYEQGFKKGYEQGFKKGYEQGCNLVEEAVELYREGYDSVDKLVSKGVEEKLAKKIVDIMEEKRKK